MSIPVATLAKALAYGRSLDGIEGSSPAWVMYVFYERCVLSSGRGIRFGLITRPEGPYRF